jgi:hypothetical protein
VEETIPRTNMQMEFKIKIGLKEMWCKCRDGIQMGQDTVT